MKKFCEVMLVISIISIIYNLLVLIMGGDSSVSEVLSTAMSILGFVIMYKLLGETEEMEYGLDELQNKMEYRMRNGKEKR